MWVARVELIDHHTGRLVNAHSHFKLREEPMLLMEFHGSPTGVKEQAELVQELAIGLPYFLVGHVGEGNFHSGYLVDPASAQERATAEGLNRQLVTQALAMDGTCTGEQGVGLHKMDSSSQRRAAALWP